MLLQNIFRQTLEGRLISLTQKGVLVFPLTTSNNPKLLNLTFATVQNLDLQLNMI